MLSPIQNAFRKLGSALERWRDRERAFAELMALDDRTLADIGIHRTEIPFVIAGTADRTGSARPLGGAGNPANSNAAAQRRVA